MIDLKVNGQTLRDIELIIFDKDGTLFELHSYWSVIANKRAELICKYAGLTYNHKRRDHIAYIMGVDNQNKCMRPDSMIGINKRSEIETELYTQLNKDGFEISLEDIKKAFVETDIYLENNFISNYKNCLQTTIPIKGIIAFLNALDNNCKCAVLSFDHTNNIHKCLNSVGMDKYFSFVIGGDILHNAKPDPEGALTIMKALNVHPSNTLMIGDTMNDILCGQSALCRCIARKSELSQISLIKTTHASIINDFTEIEVIS